jgi:hypothetical protein
MARSKTEQERDREWGGSSRDHALAKVCAAPPPQSPNVGLWVCLICGDASCGGRADPSSSLSTIAVCPPTSSAAGVAGASPPPRLPPNYSHHARLHYERTFHAYAVEASTQTVWDFAGRGFVHRLLCSEGGGKIVETAGMERGGMSAAASAAAFSSSMADENSDRGGGGGRSRVLSSPSRSPPPGLSRSSFVGASRSDCPSPTFSPLTHDEECRRHVQLESLASEYSSLLRHALNESRRVYDSRLRNINATWKEREERALATARARTTPKSNLVGMQADASGGVDETLADKGGGGASERQAGGGESVTCEMVISALSRELVKTKAKVEGLTQKLHVRERERDEVKEWVNALKKNRTEWLAEIGKARQELSAVMATRAEVIPQLEEKVSKLMLSLDGG